MGGRESPAALGTPSHPGIDLGALPSQVARPKKRDPPIEASLKQHASLIRDAKRDGETIALIDGLLKEYEDMHPSISGSSRRESRMLC